jgi:hypothetical protein
MESTVLMVGGRTGSKRELLRSWEVHDKRGNSKTRRSFESCSQLESAAHNLGIRGGCSLCRDTICVVNHQKDLSVNDYHALAEFRHQLRRFLHFSEEEA